MDAVGKERLTHEAVSFMEALPSRHAPADYPWTLQFCTRKARPVRAAIPGSIRNSRSVSQPLRMRMAAVRGRIVSAYDRAG